MRLNLTPRITVVFVVYAAALLAGVGLLSYNTGRAALQASATSELLSAAIDKEIALNGWVDERLADLEATAASPKLRGEVARLTGAPNSPTRRNAKGQVVAELRPSIGPKYLELFVLHPATGEVLVSTSAQQEGKSKKNDPYFVNGQSGSYVKNPYQSSTLHAPAMTISTPLRLARGQLLGVLVARLDLNALNAIVQQRTGLRRSDDAYLVNPASQFATQPRFISEPAVLKQTVRTEAVRRCLAGNSGVLVAPDYRDIDAILVYRWLPARRLGLIVKMDQAEALAPAYAFGRAIVLISALALLLASALAFALARSVTRPVRVLQSGVARFGRGDLDARLPETSGDEMGLLAREFNSMARAISEKEALLRASAAQLEQRVRERTAQLEAASREVEQAARANRNMMEYSQDIICSIDEAGRFMDVSPACRKIWGYSPDELRGRLYIELVHPEDVALTNEAARRIVSGQAARNFENRYRRQDGSDVHMLWSARWSDAEKSMFCVARDITERKRGEQELRAAKVAAEEASLAKSQFLANMSHEIRTPMNGVLGPIGLLLDSKLNGQQRELTEIARSSAEALLGIINDILDLSKIEVGKLDIDPIPFNLLLAVEETASMMASKAEEKGVDLIVRYPPEVPRHVIGDPGRIRQVLANLISNAIKFTPQGHILINIEAEAPKVQEAHGASQAHGEDDITLRISVEDTGIGIAPDKIEHVFGRFNQADTSTTRRYGGTGLGLSISRQLVELMGGHIGATSTLGAGSTFSFTLRLPLQSDAPTISLPDADLSGVRILIVDDNEVNRRVLHEQLDNWRLRNHSCESGEEALQVLRAAQAAGDPFQLAILDHQMPGMDGESLGKTIKADPLLQNTILVMLTSLGQKGDAMRLKAAGFAAYLLKPTRQSEMLGALVNVWTAHSAVQASETSETAARHSGAEMAPPETSKRLWEGTRVLVVEDNIVNQKVAAMMLQSFGCRVEVAVNGREALRSLDRSPFDIIFMDCEMPEMDGYEATAEIRLRPDAKRTLPIIAVTAKATPGDRERCLQVGMDDYMSKPVKSEDFQAALKRWAPKTGEIAQRQADTATQVLAAEASPSVGVASQYGDAASRGHTSGHSSETVSALDAEVIKRLRGLAEATEASLLNQIFESFLGDGKAHISTLRGALHQDDSETLRKAAHTLKGAGANIGARRLADIAQELQALGEAGTVEGAASWVGQLEAEFERVRTEIAAELEAA
jgi:PAS domain S-box-containing protein